ncbi:MAG: hypothetical protein ABIH21_03600 [Patescibacteria group bacterium]
MPEAIGYFIYFSSGQTVNPNASLLVLTIVALVTAVAGLIAKYLLPKGNKVEQSSTCSKGEKNDQR